MAMAGFTFISLHRTKPLYLRVFSETGCRGGKNGEDDDHADQEGCHSPVVFHLLSFSPNSIIETNSKIYLVNPLMRAMPAASLRLRSAPSPRNEARGHFAADVASGVATQKVGPYSLCGRGGTGCPALPRKHTRKNVYLDGKGANIFIEA